MDSIELRTVKANNLYLYHKESTPPVLVVKLSQLVLGVDQDIEFVSDSCNLVVNILDSV